MTTRKANIPLTSRLTAYVTREEGASELRVSPSTWDEMVECGQIPPPCRFGKSGNIVRWRWADVDQRLSGGEITDDQPEPFFRGLADGTKKKRQRDAA
jgi:predicted DNA-binding transcriptional regulator AlpA